MLKIDFKSLIEKGTKPIKDDFQVCLICGSQGSGKSYYATYICDRQFKNKIIKTNMKSLRGVGKEVDHFPLIENFYSDFSDNSVFIIDELSKRYNKESKIDKPFYSWLQQSRKHKRYVFLITQEYLQVPQWLRGVASHVYITHKLPLTNLYKTDFGIPVLDKDTLEWNVDILSSIIYKRTKRVSSLYDTFESIDIL